MLSRTKIAEALDALAEDIQTYAEADEARAEGAEERSQFERHDEYEGRAIELAEIGDECVDLAERLREVGGR